MHRRLARRIDALRLLNEVQTRKPEIVNGGGLAGRQAALHPFEAALPAELGAQADHIVGGQHAGQPFDGLIDAVDLAGIGEQPIDANVGGEHPAMPVDRVGPRNRMAELIFGHHDARGKGAAPAKRGELPADGDEAGEQRQGEQPQAPKRRRHDGARPITVLRFAAHSHLPRRRGGSAPRYRRAPASCLRRWAPDGAPEPRRNRGD